MTADPSTPAAQQNVDSLDGVLNVYKPVGLSTAYYVYRLRRILGVRKVGHAGSLDPFADGVVLACVGKGTRLVERLMGLPKRYVTTLRLGVTNETFDTERPFEPIVSAKPPTDSEIRVALEKLTGEIDQAPPAFSAMRVGGVSSYKLAARGKAIELPPRKVRIDRLETVVYEWPTLTLEIECGRGTYIRAIARDLGESLGCGACCKSLRRMAVGPFRMEDAIDLRTVTPDAARAALRPVNEVIQRVSPYSEAGATG